MRELIYVTSDLHLNHYNILKLENFNLERSGLSYIKTLEQYNDMIISHINAKVLSTDTLYILAMLVLVLALKLRNY